jgi:hypothetical protein
MKEDSGRQHYDLRSIWKACSGVLKCQMEHQTGEDGGVLSQPYYHGGSSEFTFVSLNGVREGSAVFAGNPVRFVCGEIDQYRCSE